jgi:hypothetical protein
LQSCCSGSHARCQQQHTHAHTHTHTCTRPQTSLTMRRSMKGERIWCSRLTTRILRSRSIFLCVACVRKRNCKCKLACADAWHGEACVCRVRVWGSVRHAHDWPPPLHAQPHLASGSAEGSFSQLLSRKRENQPVMVDESLNTCWCPTCVAAGAQRGAARASGTRACGRECTRSARLRCARRATAPAHRTHARLAAAG